MTREKRGVPLVKRKTIEREGVNWMIFLERIQESFVWMQRWGEREKN